MGNIPDREIIDSHLNQEQIDQFLYQINCVQPCSAFSNNCTLYGLNSSHHSINLITHYCLGVSHHSSVPLQAI